MRSAMLDADDPIDAFPTAKQPDRARRLGPLFRVPRGESLAHVILNRPKHEPRNLEELQAWADGRAHRTGRVPHRERLPRRH